MNKILESINESYHNLDYTAKVRMPMRWYHAGKAMSTVVGLKWSDFVRSAVCSSLVTMFAELNEDQQERAEQLCNQLASEGDFVKQEEAPVDSAADFYAGLGDVDECRDNGVEPCVCPACSPAIPTLVKDTLPY